MRVVDFHNHFYPAEYLDALRAGPCRVAISTDSENNPVLHSPGDINVAVRGHRDIEYRESVLDQVGVDVQVLTFTAPGVHIEEPEMAVRLAGAVNDAFARIVEERGGRFTALATLPLNDPAASVVELTRAVGELGLPGAMVFSNVGGVALADERFWPLWERADELGAVIYVHPTYPVGVEAMTEYWLMPLVGFTFDTTLAAAHLVFAGVPRRFPGVRWVLAHLGGAIPYLAERLDRGFHAFSECRANIEEPPSVYLRRFYYDTVNFDPAALRLALDFAGPEHLVAGSDYPHMIGSLKSMTASIRALDVPATTEQAILAANADRLLGL
ncbi:MAG: amidohydrolase family protein [Gemmatimonadetes bacterium]|nr:amidohydrolase family protein [Gemmatimonadota bacterium]NIO33221.1 amidohydrolase family protein [Gemmatimonadota bacterium]